MQAIWTEAPCKRAAMCRKWRVTTNLPCHGPVPYLDVTEPKCSRHLTTPFEKIHAGKLKLKSIICNWMYTHTYIYIYTHLYTLTHTHIYIHTSSTAQGSGGSFKNRKPMGEVGCCASQMAERSHWWTERWLRSPLFLSLSLSVSLSFSLFLSLSLSFSLFLSLSLSLSLSFSLFLSLSLFLWLSTYLPADRSIYLSNLSLSHLSI